ncbi:MAG: CerR family C-terminal domain-containing protein [Planctomycetes bacterium]|nr:CerR family C-terminal domain-containing protein [Planctomycetota bacterium]
MRSTPPPSTPEDAGTRERLLEAAAKTIAERGFRDATVREICARAGANVAAVSYHFGSKDDLEVEAVRWACSRMPDAPWFTGPPATDPLDNLRAAIRALAVGILGRHEQWQTQLMLRAMGEPNAALDVVVREMIEPRVAALEQAIAPFLPDADARTRRLTAISIVSQLVYHRVAAPVALRLLGEREYGDRLVDEIVAHVVRFTCRSLEAAGKEPRP